MDVTYVYPPFDFYSEEMMAFYKQVAISVYKAKMTDRARLQYIFNQPLNPELEERLSKINIMPKPSGKTLKLRRYKE